MIQVAIIIFIWRQKGVDCLIIYNSPYFVHIYIVHLLYLVITKGGSTTQWSKEGGTIEPPMYNEFE
jgi:hypothetical protein